MQTHQLLVLTLSNARIGYGPAFSHESSSGKSQFYQPNGLSKHLPIPNNNGLTFSLAMAESANSGRDKLKINVFAPEVHVAQKSGSELN